MTKVQKDIDSTYIPLIINYYQKITDWYKKLSFEEKLLIPIENCCINLKKCHSHFENIQLNNIQVIKASNLINEDLYNLKILKFYYPSNLGMRAKIQYQVNGVFQDSCRLNC